MIDDYFKYKPLSRIVNGKDDIHDIPYMENKNHVWNYQPFFNHWKWRIESLLIYPFS